VHGRKPLVVARGGTVREIVVRQLGLLVESGLLERRGRGQYAILDPVGLSIVARRASWRRKRPGRI
jgi:hypothetical protein